MFPEAAQGSHLCSLHPVFFTPYGLTLSLRKKRGRPGGPCAHVLLRIYWFSNHSSGCFFSFFVLQRKKKEKEQTQALRMDRLNKEKSRRLRTLRTPDCLYKVSVITTCFGPDVQHCRSTSLAIMDSFHPSKRTHPLASCQFMSVSSCWHVIRSECLSVFVQRLTLTHRPAWLKIQSVEDVERGCADRAENGNCEEEEVLYLCFLWPLLSNRGHQVLQAILWSSAVFRWQGSAFS